jgi:hypothetical protein
MFLTRCPLCEHTNPELSRFCNVCGVSLLRMGVCGRCGALNELGAAACHQCAAILLEPASGAPAGAIAAPPDELGEGQPAAKPEAPRGQFLGGRPCPAAEPDLAAPAYRSTHRHARLTLFQRWLIAGSAFGAVIGAMGYFTYSQWSVIDVSGLLPASRAESLSFDSRSDVGGRILKVDVAVTGRPPPALPTSARPLVTAPPAPSPKLAVDAPSPPKHTSEDRARSGSRRPDPSPDTPTRATDAAAQVTHAPARLGPCTAAVAALGLCTPEPVETRE